MTSTFMVLNRIARLGSSALASLALVACGSGGADTFNNPPSSGTYAGGLSGFYEGNANRTLINTDRSYWILLGIDRANRFDQIGFVYGPNIDTKNFADGTLYDRYTPDGVMVNMNTALTSAGEQFSGNIQIRSNLQNSLFTGLPYGLNPLPIAGDWFNLTDAGGSLVNLAVGNGAFSGTDSRSCIFSGQITATSTSGFYSLSLQDANNCFSGGAITYTGIAVAETARSPYSQQLMIAAIGNGRGISLSGVR